MTLQLDLFLSRIEVGRVGPHGDAERKAKDQPDWSVSVFRPDLDGDRSFIPSMAYLHKRRGTLFGQAMVTAIIYGEESEISGMSEQEALAVVSTLAVEPAYDLARRCLSAQAAFFDDELDFDIESPPVEIDFADMDEAS